MIGRISLFPTHRGAIFIDVHGRAKALCNGQTISRASYPLLSQYWPVGAYGSTATDMVMPNIDAKYLRMHPVGTGSEIDAGFASRATNAGSLPSQAQIGTFENADFAVHVHANGTQGSKSGSDSGGNPGSFAPQTTLTTLGINDLAALNPNTPVISGASNISSFDVAHVKFYPYINLQ